MIKWTLLGLIRGPAADVRPTRAEEKVVKAAGMRYVQVPTKRGEFYHTFAAYTHLLWTSFVFGST
jgi:hypothetical protein